uniref:Fibronectin type-III domain-containing protein n=1 Tax=Macrostomum lignano TaxID=282301 RepID=A0A1I8HA44_9PLAT
DFFALRQAPVGGSESEGWQPSRQSPADAAPPDGYMFGELVDGKSGYIPSNFVQQFASDSPETARIAANASADSNPLAPGEWRVIVASNFAVQHESILLRSIAGSANSGKDGPPPVPPPRELRVERQMASSVLLSWRQPAHDPASAAAGDTPTSYEVLLDGRVRCRLNSVEKTRTLLESVPANERHRVSVRSVTASNRKSDEAACTVSVGGGPDSRNWLAPTSLQISHLTGKSAVLAFLPAASALPHSVQLNGAETHRCEAGGRCRIRFDGLKPDTLYRAEVRALPSSGRDLAGLSAGGGATPPILTAAVEFRTGLRLGRPEPPANVQVESGPQNETLLVTWTPLAGAESKGTRLGGYAIYADASQLVATCRQVDADHCVVAMATLPKNARAVTCRTVATDQDGRVVESEDSSPACELDDVILPASSSLSQQEQVPLPHDTDAAAAAGGATATAETVTDAVESVEAAAETGDGVASGEELEAATIATETTETGAQADFEDEPQPGDPGFFGRIKKGFQEFQEKVEEFAEETNEKMKEFNEDTKRKMEAFNEDTRKKFEEFGEGTKKTFGNFGESTAAAFKKLDPTSLGDDAAAAPKEETAEARIPINKVKTEVRPGTPRSRPKPTRISNSNLNQHSNQSSRRASASPSRRYQTSPSILGTSTPRRSQQVQQQQQHVLEQRQKQIPTQQPTAGRAPHRVQRYRAHHRRQQADDASTDEDGAYGQSDAFLVDSSANDKDNNQSDQDIDQGKEESFKEDIVEEASTPSRWHRRHRRHRHRHRSSRQQPNRIFVALYDYDPASMSPNPDGVQRELAFLEGQLLTVFGSRDADGFYNGECAGKIGLIPGNMVADVSEYELTQSKMKQSSAGHDAGSDLPGNQQLSKHHDSRKKQQKWKSATTSPLPQQIGRSSRQRQRSSSRHRLMVALHDFEPDQALNCGFGFTAAVAFRSGDLITPLGQTGEDGFLLARVERSRLEGFVPRELLRVLSPDE